MGVFHNIPVGIAAVTMIYYSLPNFKLPNIKKIIDYWGIITFILVLTALFLAITFAGDINKYPSWEIIGLILFSIFMFMLFLLAETKAVEPILPLRLFKNSIFNVSSLESFLSSALMFSGVVYIPLFAQGVLGMIAGNSAIIMIPMLLSLTLTSIVTGQIISRTGKYKKLVISEFIITGTGVVLLATMDIHTPYYLLLIYSTILGIGSGMAYNIFNIAVQNAFTLQEIGTVTASMRFFRNLGIIIFVPIFGYIMNLTVTSSSVATMNKTQALTLSIHNIFLRAIILSFLALIIAFFLKEIPLDGYVDLKRD